MRATNFFRLVVLMLPYTIRQPFRVHIPSDLSKGLTSFFRVIFLTLPYMVRKPFRVHIPSDPSKRMDKL